MKCLGEHPLMAGRIEGHHSTKETRQKSLRSFPPQSVKTSLVAKIVETWERLPCDIRDEEKESVMKAKVKQWAKAIV